MKLYQNGIKRILDVLISLAGLIVLSPVFLLLILLVPYFFNAPPFFVQKRLGKDGKIFSIIKFRSMTGDTDASGNLLDDEKRTTSFGRFLRKSSLDEIPQLINVLKGDMSLVGPRPMLPFYNGLYSSFQRQRNRVRPGITGLAQVSGRNQISWYTRFRLDVWYVSHVSFWMDMHILLRTFQQWFKGKNVEHTRHIPQEFEGNP
ncbi:sugar transferase [Chryseobacterium taklimakanense]|uniref:sugar transferase n=1 Tax=Chryseobacterium taklimakanense TaxID=536441 RepID=UPI00293E24AA|nr:sugar transferase [Chryseobacterium taklimakanense]